MFLSGRNESALTERSPSLAALGFRFMVFAAVRSVDFACTGKPETLFGSAVGFLFRHMFILRIFFLSLSVPTALADGYCTMDYFVGERIIKIFLPSVKGALSMTALPFKSPKKRCMTSTPMEE